MKKSVRTDFALIQDGQFRAHIAHKEGGHFNKVSKKMTFL